MEPPPAGRVTRSKKLIQPQLLPLQDAKVTVSDTGIIKLKKTLPPCTEAFEGQLEWKRHFSEIPMTSTPVPKQKVEMAELPLIQPDVNIMDIEISFVSPIQKPERRVLARQALAQRKDQNHEPPGEPNKVHNVDVTSGKPIHNFDELLYKYGDDSKENGEEELQVHIERTKAKTYKRVTHKEVPEIVRFAEVKDKGEAIQGRGKKRIKKKALAKMEKPKSSSKGKGDELKPNAVDWIKKTNEEFADVMNFDICVEKQ